MVSNLNCALIKVRAHKLRSFGCHCLLELCCITSYEGWNVDITDHFPLILLILEMLLI